MYLSQINCETIAMAIEQMDVQKNDTLMLLLAECEKHFIPELIHLLNSKNISFFGGIFPGLIFGKKEYKEGGILCSFSLIQTPLVLDLSSEQMALSELVDVTQNNNSRKPTALVLVDGLASNISVFLSELFNQLGNYVNYFGGGAGSLTLKSQPCLFTHQGFVKDRAIVALIDQPIKLGVRHGWERLIGPLVATLTHGNVVSELNWKVAFDVYKEIIEADSTQIIDQDNFFSIAKGYPFGLTKEYGEDIVRDPLSVNTKGGLVCVGEVPENSVLSILKGTPQSLIQAAKQAVEDCFMQGDVNHVTHHLVVECISRVIFLEERFEEELEVIQDMISVYSSGQNIMGVLSIGEISSYGDGLLEFFNKTTVVGVLHR